MADTWLCDVGIRVTDLSRSLSFYTSLLDVEILKQEADEDSAYVLLKDRRSGQRLELNYYADSSPFYAPFVVGEGLDHIEVRVRDVPELLKRLAARGIVPVNRKLWTNPRGIERARSELAASAAMEKDVWTTASGHRVAYIPDPDGNLICLYDHPEEAWEGPIPDHY